MLSGDTTKIIKNASDLLFTITPTALKGATISNVKINDVNATLSSGNYVLNITDLTTGTFNIVITDSRGLTKTYTATKTLLDYIACQINTWSIERETQVSSNLKLNANVNVWGSTINGTTNTIVVKYSIDNENWTTIPSSSYSISDNVLTITNLILQNIVSYQNIATFYLDISDLLSETKENYQIAKGIETWSQGENDIQVNGEIYIADEEGENEHAIRNYIIEESGNNYIKYADGTMICYGKQEINTSVSNSWNNLYASGIITGTNFAKEFTTINSVVMTPLRGGTFWIGTAETGTTIATTKLPNIYILSGANLPSQTFVIGYTAIGRWK